jgi:hypothetical protein
MSSLIPLNYPSTQAEAQVAQFIESAHPSLLSDQNTVLDTVARSVPGSLTVTFVGE